MKLVIPFALLMCTLSFAQGNALKDDNILDSNDAEQNLGLIAVDSALSSLLT
jgi:hypothetical protein